MAELLIDAKADVNAEDVSANLMSLACIKDCRTLLSAYNRSLVLVLCMCFAVDQLQMDRS